MGIKENKRSKKWHEWGLVVCACGVFSSVVDPAAPVAVVAAERENSMLLFCFV
jgi:hypothetical protein